MAPRCHCRSATAPDVGALFEPVEVDVAVFEGFAGSESRRPGPHHTGGLHGLTVLGAGIRHYRFGSVRCSAEPHFDRDRFPMRAAAPRSRATLLGTSAAKLPNNVALIGGHPNTRRAVTNLGRSDETGLRGCDYASGHNANSGVEGAYSRTDTRPPRIQRRNHR